MPSWALCCAPCMPTWITAKFSSPINNRTPNTRPRATCLQRMLLRSPFVSRRSPFGPREKPGPGRFWSSALGRSAAPGPPILPSTGPVGVALSHRVTARQSAGGTSPGSSTVPQHSGQRPLRMQYLERPTCPQFAQLPNSEPRRTCSQNEHRSSDTFVSTGSAACRSKTSASSSLHRTQESDSSSESHSRTSASVSSLESEEHPEVSSSSPYLHAWCNSSKHLSHIGVVEPHGPHRGWYRE